MKIATYAMSFSLLAAPVLAAPPQVVTDIPITGSLVQQVLGDLGEVHVLVGSGADPHHFQMRPSNAKSLESAGLLVWMGPELTPWLERATENLTATQTLELLDVDGTYLQNFGEGKAHDHAAVEDHDHDEEGHDHAEHAHEEGHDHDHGEHDHEGHDHEGHDHENHGHEGHDHSGTDPHAWLDPANAQLWLTEIATELAELDPENAETYTANAKAAGESIAQAEKQIAADLAPLQDQSFVVFHDAYGYFTGHFDLKPAIAVSLGDASAPSAARISEIKKQITESGVSCAFPEFGHDGSLIDSAIESSEVEIGSELDPEGRGFEQGAGLYNEVLQSMTKALMDCLANKS